MFRPRRAYIRQREVGRDTPSFEQALLDALREDPDVLMVGEMREPETMRLTLNASETGHLVLATVHSSTCAEALQRVVSAFPSEIQSSVSAQLADSLVAVVSQRLRFRPEINIRVPECEILIATHAVKNFIRNRDFFKIISAIESGGEHGMWSFQRYRTWLDTRTNWQIPNQNAESSEIEPVEAPAVIPGPIVSAPKPGKPEIRLALPSRLSPDKTSSRIEIEPVEGDFGKILKRPGEP
jgi:twitching motility protein PilT